MSKITELDAIEILDSRGNPTIADLAAATGVGQIKTGSVCRREA